MFTLIVTSRVHPQVIKTCGGPSIPWNQATCNVRCLEVTLLLATGCLIDHHQYFWMLQGSNTTFICQSRNIFGFSYRTLFLVI